MENKEIYIDGVDVSGCELYRDDNGVFAPDGTAERTELCYLTNDYCGNNPNCYYKQLKRKEQECKNLREAMHKDRCSHYVLGECSQTHHNNCVGKNQCIKDLEQKLEKIKEIINTHKQNKCKSCSEFDKCLGHPYRDEVILKIIEE